MESQLGYFTLCRFQFKAQTNAEKIYYKYSEEIAQTAISSRYRYVVFCALSRVGIVGYIYEKFSIEYAYELQNCFWDSFNSLCFYSLFENC